MTDDFLSIGAITRKRWKTVISLVVVIAMMIGLAECAIRVGEFESAQPPREDVIADNEGREYIVRTIEYNGNTYTCFSYDYRVLACAKE